ncbi:MAG: hypothetical protein ABIJ75_07150 [Actinomycetota bacterium]
MTDDRSDQLKSAIQTALFAENLDGYFVHDVYAIARVINPNGNIVQAFATTMEDDPISQLGMLSAEVIRVKDQIRLIHGAMYERRAELDRIRGEMEESLDGLMDDEYNDGEDD